jgi:hypothetical protein
MIDSGLHRFYVPKRGICKTALPLSSAPFAQKSVRDYRYLCPQDSILSQGLIKIPEKSIVRFVNGFNSRFNIALKTPPLFFRTYRIDQRQLGVPKIKRSNNIDIAYFNRLLRRGGHV